MAQKITLTGVPVTGLRCLESMSVGSLKVYSFDLEEKGSPNSPKGLPQSSTILFTVFANSKQLSKANITSANIKSSKLLIQGELSLDVNKNDCPGELGVVATQIQIIVPKEEQKDVAPETKIEPEPVKDIEPPKEVPKEDIKKEIPEKKPEVKATQKVKETNNKPVVKTVEFIAKKQPPHDELVPLDTIKIPQEFLMYNVNPKKLQQTRDHIKYAGFLDSAIKVDKETMTLVDGYRRYVVAKELNIELVPVVYAVDEKESEGSNKEGK